jgi:hypothetical protein
MFAKAAKRKIEMGENLGRLVALGGFPASISENVVVQHFIDSVLKSTGCVARHVSRRTASRRADDVAARELELVHMEVKEQIDTGGTFSVTAD